ncbi:MULTISPECIES: response regulator [Terrabacteria group]|uniref:response regulator transcription factor n=1 Tax=Bacillati TaxID=1783272 RepID=UPI001C6F2E02|nr:MULTISPECIES: response regulator [Terrabacteria group]MBW9212196.1 response regulator [Trueperella sp. zg.1013]
MNILIADDEEIIRQNFMKRIIKAGLPFDLIFKATNGEEALQLFKEESMDIALIDINMPFKNGLDLIRDIRQQNKEVILIIVSGYDNFRFAQQALELGVFRYLLKPVDAQEFISVIQEAMEQINQHKKPPYSLLTKKILKDIQANISNESYGLKDLANHLQFSEGHITKLIKKELAKTFVDLVTELRIQHAKYLIDNNEVNYKMYEIAEACGFHNQYYFSQVFKKVVGVSPKQYSFRNLNPVIEK